LVREDLPYLVVEDLGCRAGDRAEAGIAQHADVRLVVHAGAPGAVHDLHWGEGMDVQRGMPRFDRDEDVPVGERIHVGVDATLHADFGGAARDRLVHLGEHDVHPVRVGVLLPALALERTEPAVDEADVREVDVAVDYVGHVVTDVGASDLVGGAHDREQVGTGHLQQVLRRLDGQRAAVEHVLDRVPHGGGGIGEGAWQGSIAQRDCLDVVPRIEPAHVWSSTVYALPPTRIRSSGATHCGSVAKAGYTGRRSV